MGSRISSASVAEYRLTGSRFSAEGRLWTRSVPAHIGHEATGGYASVAKSFVRWRTYGSTAAFGWRRTQRSTKALRRGRRTSFGWRRWRPQRWRSAFGRRTPRLKSSPGCDRKRTNTSPPVPNGGLFLRGFSYLPAFCLRTFTSVDRLFTARIREGCFHRVGSSDCFQIGSQGEFILREWIYGFGNRCPNISRHSLGARMCAVCDVCFGIPRRRVCPPELPPGWPACG